MSFDDSNDFLSGKLNGFEGGNSEFQLQQLFDVNSEGVSFSFGNNESAKERWHLIFHSSLIKNDFNAAGVSKSFWILQQR